ncbi:hypothetical protein KDAU_41440 [Dictyobacter aurantiacus]|uniref:Fucose-specific lectin n=2 Tax=Dictyobacter aurantiacus TaxID=1936993 RepID=A0A401ZIY6_9CHLR|nr:hypothetical protein KDAU_41440 [Dictyobacter aurantiacus]
MEKTQELPDIKQRKRPVAPFMSSTIPVHEEQSAATDVDPEATLILEKASISVGDPDATPGGGEQGSPIEDPRLYDPPILYIPGRIRLVTYKYKEKKSRRKEAPVYMTQRSWAIQTRRRARPKHVVLPLAVAVILLLGGGGAFYYLGLLPGHAAGGSKPALTPHPTMSARARIFAAPTLQLLPVQGGAVATSQTLSDGSMQTVYLDTNSHVQQLSSKDGISWQQNDLTLATRAAVSNGKALTTYSWGQTDRQQVAFIDVLGHIHVLSSGANDHWQVLDVTQRAQAPLADGVILVSYTTLTDSSQHIVYIDQQKHIQMLSSTDGVQWQTADLTKATDAPLSNGIALSAFSWSKDGSEHIAYVDQSRHVQELYSTASGKWRDSDLTQSAGAPLANGNVIVAYEWRIAGSIHIDYIDVRNNIQELSRTALNAWFVSDLTTVTNRPLAAGKSLAAYDWVQGNMRVVVYVDESKHVQELALPPFDRWQGNDLTQQAVIPLASDSGLAGMDWSVTGTKQVVFVDATNRVHELTGFPGGRWKLSNW